jgi:hypothetical protein
VVGSERRLLRRGGVDALVRRRRVERRGVERGDPVVEQRGAGPPERHGHPVAGRRADAALRVSTAHSATVAAGSVGDHSSRARSV